MGITLPVKFYAVEKPFFIEPERKSLSCKLNTSEKPIFLSEC